MTVGSGHVQIWALPAFLGLQGVFCTAAAVAGLAAKLHVTH